MDCRFRETPAGTVATIESFTAGSAAPLVHFAHATGMCAALYVPLLERLAPHVNVVASDARGHGATRLAADPAAMTSWTTYADDLGAMLDVLPPPPKPKYEPLTSLLSDDAEASAKAPRLYW